MAAGTPGEFAGKTALVTGSGSGIGRAVALAFARSGANLALADVNEAGLAETVALAGGAEAWTMALDVTRADQVEAFVNGALDRFGSVDCAANCAGIRATVKAFDEYTEEEFDRVMAINLKGVWLCMKYQMAAMRKAGRGAIVNIASGAGVIAVPSASSYVTSKHAVVGLTKSAAVDAAALGIRINAVCPGYTRTPMALGSIAEMPGLTVEMAALASPIARIAEPEEQADAVLYLCSDRASFVVGHAFVVDGGHSIQ